MVARGHGGLINVSSQLAFSAALPAPPLPPGRAVYAATKAYVNAFTQLLDGELAGTGVRVQALCPGVMRTEFYARMGTDLGRLPTRPMEPSQVVSASLAALQRGEVLCAPGLDDASALDRVRDDERRIFEQTSADTLAERGTRQAPSAGSSKEFAWSPRCQDASLAAALTAPAWQMAVRNDGFVKETWATPSSVSLGTWEPVGP
jgi:short chain dehydrogenase